MTNDGEINLSELNSRPVSIRTNSPDDKQTINKATLNSTKTNKSSSCSGFKWCCLKSEISWKITFVFLCVCCFFQNLVTSGVATVILSTIEREFFWSSTQSGLFLALFELAAFIASPFFGFLG